MSNIKVLIEGRAQKIENGWLASPSTVLIRDGGLNILADPGSNKELLMAKLGEEGLNPGDINAIFLTHLHLDNILNISLFGDCDILLDGDRMNGTDKVFSYSDNIPGTDIKVISTPGHTLEHSSLLVQTPEGIVAVAGDLFWWLAGEEQITDRKTLLDRQDPGGAKDEGLLRQSRQKILDAADFIIPGHGKMFKTTRQTHGNKNYR